MVINVWLLLMYTALTVFLVRIEEANLLKG